MAEDEPSSSEPKLNYASTPSTATEARRSRLDLMSLVIGIGFEAVAGMILLIYRSWSVAVVFAVFGIIWLLFSTRILPSDD